MGSHDQDSAARFAATRAMAEAVLRREMEALGLRASDGWKVNEAVREARGGTELVLRPIHLRLDAPRGLECIVWIHGEDGTVDFTCPAGDSGT